MFDNFITSFCKVQFLCYENEPNWLGLIVLLPLVLIVGLIILLSIGAFFGTIFEWFGDTGDKINNFFRERPERGKAKKERKQAEKERKQAELEQLNRPQKVLRIIFLPFKLIGEILKFLYELIFGLIFIGGIIAIVVVLFRAIYELIIN